MVVAMLKKRMRFLWCEWLSNMVVAMWDERRAFFDVFCYMYIWYICVYYISSPYLLVFGNDRVCGRRE